MQQFIVGQHPTTQARKLQIKLNIQTIHQKLIMSGLLFKIGPFFQYLIFHDHNETVLISDPSEAYDNLKRECNVWLGKIPARFQQSILDMKKVSNYQQLLLFQERRNKELIVNVFYWEHGNNNRQLRQYYEGEQHKLSKLRFFNVFDKQSLERKKKYINLNNSKLPNFYEMCSDIKQKRNQQKINMYWMLASQNLQQSCKDFQKFYQFYLEKEIKDQNKENEELKFYHIQYHRQQFRTPETQFKLYTSDHQFHKIINNCLRSFTNPQDFAHIRFPFYRLFVSVNQLFFQQEHEQFRVKGFTCFRGCQISQQESIQLQLSVGKYIQINSFLSASFSEQIAQQFGSILFRIRVPPKTSCNTEMFGSFANIKYYSFFFQEDEIVFNPLNTFRVQGFQQENSKMYYYLQYVSIDSSFPKSPLTQNLIKHYNFQKQMLVLNRNQGEYLWRLHQKNATLYYQTKICHLLVQEKKKLQRNKGRELKQQQQVTVTEVTKILYNELKIFASGFSWYEQEQNNLLLVQSFHKSNSHRAVQMYFYIAKFHESCYDYQRVLPYLLACYNDVQRFVPSNSGLIYIIITNIGISFLNLDEYTLAMKLFQLAHTKISTNYRLWSHVYGLIISPAILAYQTGNIKDRKKFEDLLDCCLKVSKSEIYQNNPWLKFITTFENALTIKQFHKYYKETFNRQIAFLTRVCLQIVQQLLLEFERLSFEDRVNKTFNNIWMQTYSKEKETKKRLQFVKTNIRIIIHVLQDMNQFNLFPILVDFAKILTENIDQENKSQKSLTVSTRGEGVTENIDQENKSQKSLTVSTRGERVTENIEKQNKSQKALAFSIRERGVTKNIKQFNYFRMKSFILEVKYRTKLKFLCKNEDTQWNFSTLNSIFKVLRTKFARKFYIHLLFLIVLVEVCFYRCFFNLAFHFIGLIRKIKGRIKLILNIQKQQILFLLRKAKFYMKFMKRIIT